MEEADPALRILILNWRDLRHPRAGGAEVLTHEHARRLVERGHDVTLFVGKAPGAPASETLDGVHVLRRGGPMTTRLHACSSFRRQRVRFDVVVEEINTLPYFANRFVSAPTVLWMHQLAREVWWYEAPKPLALIGFLLERSYLRLHRGRQAIVLSPSTRADLAELGFPETRVTVVPPAIHHRDEGSIVDKEPGLLVYVGRITPSKRVGDLVEAVARVRASGLAARLQVVGRGTAKECDRIRRCARALDVEQHVHLTGYLDESSKREVLARAALVLMASVREGWGLTITEANALGTPAVVYDRPGLRDSTLHERTGLVTPPDPASLAAAIVRALTEPGLYGRLQVGAASWASTFTWERASAAFEQALLKVACGETASRDLPCPA